MMPGDALDPIGVAVDLLPPDDDGRPSLTEDYEMGGIALNDPSQGLLVQHWRARLDGDDVLVGPDPYSSESVVITDADITELSLAFDQNMRPTIAYVAAGVTKLYWYDTVPEQHVTTVFNAEDRSPFVTMDDKRAPATLINTNDVLFFYIRGTTLYYRQQRDRFQTERALATVGADQFIVKCGMSRALRVQVHLSS